MGVKPNIKSAPGKCKLVVQETDTRDAIVTEAHPMGAPRTIAYVAIGAESWGPLLAAAPDLSEALDRLLALLEVSELDFPDSPGVIRADHPAVLNARAALAKAVP